jgi:hypothetical protein
MIILVIFIYLEEVKLLMTCLLNICFIFPVGVTVTFPLKGNYITGISHGKNK